MIKNNTTCTFHTTCTHYVKSIVDKHILKYCYHLVLTTTRQRQILNILQFSDVCSYEPQTRIFQIMR